MATKPELPYKVVVEENRKRGYITNWGSAPFYQLQGGQIIPDGFSMESTHIGTSIEVTTRVVAAADGSGASLYYMFQRANSEKLKGGLGSDYQGAFCNTPTAALDNFAMRLKQENIEPFASKYRLGTNGKLHAGVAYPSVQKIIREAHGFPPLPEVDPSLQNDAARSRKQPRLNQEDGEDQPDPQQQEENDEEKLTRTALYHLAILAERALQE